MTMIEGVILEKTKEKTSQLVCNANMIKILALNEIEVLSPLVSGVH